MRILWTLALLAAPVMAQQTLTLADTENPGAGPCGIVVAHSQGGAFVLSGSHFEDKISSFQLDRQTGNMTPAGVATVAPGSMPVAIGFAYGRYAVVANKQSSDLYVFGMDSSGQFTQIGQPVSSGGLNPVDMVVAPTGLVAVTNNASDEVSTFWLDFRGRLRFLDKANTGPAPAGVAIRGNRIAVANSGSGDVSVFRLNRLRNLQLMDTTAINANPVDLDFGPGGNLYVIGASQQGQELKRFRLQRNGQLNELASVDAGLFVSGIDADRRGVYLATVTSSFQNEIRVYDRRLNQTASATLATAPNSMTVAAARVRGGRYVIVNEFGNNSTSSFKLQ